MMNKTSLLITAALIASPVLPAFADRNSNTYDMQAKVISVTPQYEKINSPREDCHTEFVTEVYQNEQPSAAGSIIGGITGGLLGSTIGKGSGRVAAAAIGAGIGAVVGDRVDNQNNPTKTVQRPIEQCTLVDSWHTIQHGYLVSYLYNGQTFNTITDKHPGESIRIRISVTPAGDEVSSYHAPVTYRYAQPVVYVDRPLFDGLYISGDWGWRGGYHHGPGHH
jgi:uncharacterized protein YcfJ